MRGLKLAAIAIGAVLALILVLSVVGFIVHAIAYVAVIALVAGGVYVAFKVGRASNRQVSKGSKERESEVQDSRSARPLPRADVQTYTPPAPPTVSRPVTSQNVDDELAKLKREMGS
jgi:hypothetical protein